MKIAFSVVGWLVGVIGLGLFGVATWGTWVVYVEPFSRSGKPAWFAGATSTDFGFFELGEPWCWVFGFGCGTLLMLLGWGMVWQWRRRDA